VRPSITAVCVVSKLERECERIRIYRVAAATALELRFLRTFQSSLRQHGMAADYLSRFNTPVLTDRKFNFHVSGNHSLSRQARVQRRIQLGEHDPSFRSRGAGRDLSPSVRNRRQGKYSDRTKLQR
jgi:hypothetical protein